MRYWIKVAGTGENPFTDARWQDRRARFASEGRLPSLFPRRPRIERGDRLVLYASGSAAEYGEARIFAIEEVISPEPEPSGRERWTWMVETRLLAGAPSLAVAPGVRAIGVSPKSLRQHSHIRISAEQGRRAEALMGSLARVTREERLAANESRFREINEGSRAISGTDPNSIYCECSDRSCVYRVTIDVEKYVEVRSDDRRFIVRPGHEVTEIETVVERQEDFFVVEKPAEMDHIVSQ